MTPAMDKGLKSFLAAYPHLDEKLVREHFTRLGKPYFERYGQEQIARHLEGLARLTPEHPVEVGLFVRGDAEVECTILAFDYQSLFSVITGSFAGQGLVVVSGDVFTYRPAHPAEPQKVQPMRPLARSRNVELYRRRRIVDHFMGVKQSKVPFATWEEKLKKSIEEAVCLLEKGDAQSVAEAKHRVNEMVVKRLDRLQVGGEPILYPVRITVDNATGPYTRLQIVSEDTPAFLYSLTNALSLHRVSIEHVRIRTFGGRIEDEIDLLDAGGLKIEDPAVLDRIKLSVLLTKQFTYFLGKAPDPYAALCRYEYLVDDILRLPGGAGEGLEILSNPVVLKDLGRLLGASEYLWEDFIRLQYEALLPMIAPQVKERRFSTPTPLLEERLKESLRGVATLEERRDRLNAFKDREIFLIDLDHLLHTEVGLWELAERLTRLAENVLNTAITLVHGDLVERFGLPRTAAGLEAAYALLGLGKLGGSALGYASDIEFLLVYSDNGKTDGSASITNSEFFERLVKEASLLIKAKREGIFHVDLRLRPHGSAGPLACSLEAFCGYYGPGGMAHSYERLALVRLRALGGDRALGARVERIRDELVYFSHGIDIVEVQRLREKQFLDKTQGGKENAKYSPGGLVDLEYCVQMLQVLYGKEKRTLRTPQINEALVALTETGVLAPEETQLLITAYVFLRRLINAMRMLRGSALDLFLPPIDSLEFSHLARRMGYQGGGALDPAQQLRLDYETHTAAVRAFAEKHFGRKALPGQPEGSLADLVLSDDAAPDAVNRILAGAGFRETRRALTNLRYLAGTGVRRHTFARLAVLAKDILMRTPDPDMALNNWERFIRALPSAEFHYNLLLSQPMRMEILLTILSGSQFLADTLIRNPGFLDWVIIPENLHTLRKRRDVVQELEAIAEGCQSHRTWLNQMRRYRRREILRIGTRDMYLKAPTQQIMAGLSILAESMVEVTLRNVWTHLREEGRVPEAAGVMERGFCVLAFGKLGGGELNYSSDIDLLGICQLPRHVGEKVADGLLQFKTLLVKVMETLTLDLSSHTEEGYAYRVDLRLRPYGRGGELVYSVAQLLHYYQNAAALWEVQAALKLRPIAGNLGLGEAFLGQVRSILLQHRDPKDVVRSVERMRSAAIRRDASRGVTDVKSGLGSLRDIEFLVQGLQLIHAPDHPDLLLGNTLNALEALADRGLLPEEAGRGLQEDYLFLRRVEHYLQILEDQQIHALPREPAELSALAKRVLGVEATAAHFIEAVQDCSRRIRETYVSQLLQRTA